jgi:hypothetical protein
MKAIKEIRRRMEWYDLSNDDIEHVAVDLLLDYVKERNSLRSNIKVVIVK